MSLINKMLTDLEARKQASGHGPAAKPVYEDLRPAMGMSSVPRRSRVKPLLAVGLLLFAALLGWDWWQASQEPAPEVAAVAQPAPKPQEPVAQPQPQVAPAPNAVEAAPVSAPSAPAALPEPAMQATPEPTVVASPLSSVVAPAPVSEPKEPKVTTPAKAKAAAAGAPTQSPAKPKETAPAKPKAKVAAKAATPKASMASAESTDATVIDKKNRPLTPEEQAETAYRAGVNSLKQRQNAKAESELKRALAASAVHTQARELLAGLLLDGGRWAEAVTLLEQGLQARPEYYGFAQLLARVHLEHGAEPKALSVLEASVAQGGRDAEYLGFLAALYQRAGRHADAVTSYRSAIALRPFEARWWAGIGISLEAEKNWAGAEEAYQRARDIGSLAPALSRYVEERLAYVKSRR